MRRIVVMVVLVMLLLSASGVTAKPKDEVCCPSQWATTMDVSQSLYELAENVPMVDQATMESLPLITPFWKDLTDCENVPNDGEGVYIAVLDTGLVDDWAYYLPEDQIATELGMGFSHDVEWDPMLGDFAWDPVNSDRGYITEWYGSGHGTHVTSTLTGFQLISSMWVDGVAPKATIIPVLVIDYWWLECPDPDYYDPSWDVGVHDGYVMYEGGTEPMVAGGINYIADLAPTLDGPVIISMSLGGGSPSSMIEDAIDHAISEGVIVVASAGNNGEDGMGWPGAFPQVISAGAGGWTGQRYPPGYPYWWRGDQTDVPEALNTMDALGNNWQIFLEGFSSRPARNLGQKKTDLDVVTPGSSILGPYIGEVFWYEPGGYWARYGPGWYWMWGTSMAAPMVSGIAALVLEEFPMLAQDEMEFILVNAAHGLPFACDGAIVYNLESAGYDYYYYSWRGGDWGAGMLQADAALWSAYMHA